MARTGYTLPVFACAAAKAALLQLLGQAKPELAVTLDLLEPAQTVTIPVEQVAKLGPHSALAITRSDPGDNLDLTRDTPIWAQVQWQEAAARDASPLQLDGGEGLGIRADGSPAIYAYAQKLFAANLEPWLTGRRLRVQIILPEGKALAQRTSNEAFGVVEGLSLLGTTGLSQPLSAPDQLAEFVAALQAHAGREALVLCVGENGLDLAAQMGIDPQITLKTANWLGPMLVAAAQVKVRALLLFGYHGKLLKLAAGIFHTHHSLADARAEILTAHCALAGLPPSVVARVYHSDTADVALTYLRETVGAGPVHQLYTGLANRIDQRAQAYIRKHADRSVSVGSLLFDRRRQVIVCSATGERLLTQILENGSDAGA